MLELGKNALKIGSGATPRGGKSAYLDHGPYALVRSQNVYNHGFESDGLAYISEDQARKLSNVELLENDVLINITGDSVARVCLVDPSVLPARVNQHVAILRPDPSAIDPFFLRYFLVKPSSQSLLLALASAGATRNALTKSMLESLEVPDLDVELQRSIGYFLKSLDDKIELNRRMNKTLEEMARALFRDWFVDFGPTRRQMEGATNPVAIMGHAFSTEKAATLAPLFPIKLSDDGLPEGWEMETLGDFAERSDGSIQTGPFGSQLHKSDYVEKGVPVLMPANLTYSQIKTDGIAYISEDKAASLARHRCKPGDIIYGRRGDIGRKALITKAQNGWFCGTGCLKVSIHSHERSPNVLFMQLDTEGAVQWIRSRAIGATMPNLNTKTLGGLPILKIGSELSTPFTELAEPLEEKKQHNIAENQSLAELRDLLLPKLMSGKVRLNSKLETNFD